MSMMARFDILPQNARFRILRMLENNSRLSQRDLAHELEKSQDAVNYCLHAFIENKLGEDPKLHKGWPGSRHNRQRASRRFDTRNYDRPVPDCRRTATCARRCRRRAAPLAGE